MTEAELRERLRTTPIESDPDAEERAWRLVRAAYPRPGASRRRRWRAIAPALACTVAIAAIVVATTSAPREALARWFRQAIGLSAQPHPQPRLARLPSPGQILVNTPNGPWIVHADGTRQYLGPYTAAAWSPHSLYVIAWHRSQLAALNPQGHQQWTLASRAQVTVARWSPDGYRIAYTAGRWLRIVAGDGSNDHQLASIVATVAPAWQPHTGPEHRVAYLDHAGYIELRDADTRALVWRSKPRALPQRLLWSPDGTRLLTVEAHRLSLYDPRGRLITTSTIASGDTAGPAAFAAGHRLAMILRPVDETANSVVLLDATKRGFRRVPQTVFTAPEQLTGIDWSPDHQWLITASASADQWIFIRVTAPTRLSAVSEIAKQLRPKHGGALGSPLLAGWQS